MGTDKKNETMLQLTIMLQKWYWKLFRTNEVFKPYKTYIKMLYYKVVLIVKYRSST